MVKQCVAMRLSISFFAAMLVACGGAPPKRGRIDPYSARVGDCVESPAANSAVPMIAVPTSEAVLGSTEGERAQARIDYGAGGENLFRNEAPVRRAHVQGFELDRSPVTNRLFAEFVGACGVIPPDAESLPQDKWEQTRRYHGFTQPYEVVRRFLWEQGVPAPGREDHPVVLVTHDQAAFYCAWRGARLPTEKEWERASRGVTGNSYPWGSRYDGFRVFGRVRGSTDTSPVGSLPQGNTREGFTDMGGHVWEWTDTRWEGRKGHFVVKGNAWDGRPGYGRGAAHDSRAKDAIDVALGFRCAADT
jgi:formylglycine-generating enzyme required for sulfatase activity